MRQQGKVIKWLDDKGYGFVNADGSNEQIFVHISAFPKGQERPNIGEIITFEIAKDSKKGLQAYNVLYSSRPAKARNKYKPRNTKKQKNYSIFSLLLLSAFGYFAWIKLNPIEKEAGFFSRPDVPKTEAFQCASKTHCSEMISCEEATYYLNHCPGTVMDGDGDGQPCEDQWCGH